MLVKMGSSSNFRDGNLQVFTPQNVSMAGFDVKKTN